MFKPMDIIGNNKGLTLVETLVAIALGSVAVMGSFTLLTGVQGTMTENSEAVQAQQEARNILQRIAREVRESSPEKTWIYSWSDYENEGDADTIFFYTSRDKDSRFIVDDSGKPDWQREISYALDRYSNHLYRFQYYMSLDEGYPYQWEIVSRNVEKLSFEQVNDMLVISIRTFADTAEGTGNVARAYANFHTMINLRN